MNKLKPCPFCGNKDNKVTDVVGFYYVKCKNCFAGTRPFLTSEGAVDAWNTRAHSECYLDSPCEYQNEDIRMGKEVENNE